MTITIEAVYENGVLRPTEPLPLKEYDRVRVTIHTPADILQAQGILGWKGSSEELAPFALDPELEGEEVTVLAHDTAPAAPPHSLLDVPPVGLGPILRPLTSDDDLLGEMLEGRP